MGLYTQENLFNESAELKHPEELLEAYIYDEVSALSDEGKKAFIESEECRILEAKKLINRKTIVRLNKNDDVSRRTTMAAMQLAREKGDVMWDKLVKVRILERKYLRGIEAKYGSRAQRVAKMGQRDYLKNKMGAKFLKPADLNNRV